MAQAKEEVDSKNKKTPVKLEKKPVAKKIAEARQDIFSVIAGVGIFVTGIVAFGDGLLELRKQQRQDHELDNRGNL